MGKIKIIGFTGNQRKKISGFVIGKREFLQKIDAPEEKKIELHSNFKEIENLIKELSTKDDVNLIVSGDPLFYSLGEKIAELFPESVVIPEISYMQLAFARIKKSWKKASFLSLHGRKIEFILPALTRTEKFLFIFTDPNNNPTEISKFLLENRIDDEDIKFYVFEKLNTPHEKIYSITPSEASKTSFSEPNCIIIEKLKNYPDPFKDEFYKTKRGLLTKTFIRGLILSLLGYEHRNVIWDVGAGTGAVSITLSKISNFVFAIEKEMENFNILKDNIKTFGAWNVIPINNKAPEVFENLDQPDAVFIGTGIKNPEIILKAYEKLKNQGVLIATFVSIESLEKAAILYKNLKAKIFNISIITYEKNIPQPRIPVWIMISQKFI